MCKFLRIIGLFALLIFITSCAAPQEPNFPRTVTGGNSVTVNLGEGNPIFTVRSSSGDGNLEVASVDPYRLYVRPQTEAGYYVDVQHAPAGKLSEARYFSKLIIKDAPDTRFELYENKNITVTFSTLEAQVEIIVGK